MAQRKNLLPLVVVFLLTLSFLYFYIFFRNSPQYSLLQLSEAYKNKDVSKAQQYVDVDAISAQVADEVVLEIKNELDKPVSRENFWSAWIRNISTGFVESALPSIGAAVEDSTRSVILDDISGERPSEYVPDFASLEPGHFLDNDKVDIKRQGDNRLLIIANKAGKKTELLMKKQGDKWVIFAWENFDEFSQDFVNKGSN